MKNSTRTVILSHEHADFDALASLLGGWLVFPHAQPVLPHTINRNGRAFLALYRNQLPFSEAKDLPKSHVDLAIVVDTRGYNAVKGMDKNTRVLLVDHHTVDAPPPEGWTIWQESLGPHAVGANTTLLVEKLMVEGQELSTIQATLLALGIYEDTGSLTYKSTTHRDVRCAAWLLEQGANLEIVSQFIRYPMTPAQQELAQKLIDASEHLQIAGQTIVIATADAPDFSDEISALAHRLRELYEPDGLFVAIGLGDRIQVVARSTTDAVNVGKMAEALGGGGHTRAAAALIRETNLEKVRSRIIDLARQQTRPAVTVADIMSRGRPQTVSPDMPVREAAVQMSRWGHEGFPVVEKRNVVKRDVEKKNVEKRDAEEQAVGGSAGKEDGDERLLGILTRQAADRSLNHKLGERPVRMVMNAGAVTIRPDASIDELHKRMIESGWGQIPVVDDQGRIVGIVTRTDLLKLLAETGDITEQIPDVTRQLRDALKDEQLALLRLTGQRASGMGYAVYVVGGFARDLLLSMLDHNPARMDMDIVVEGDAIKLAELLQTDCGGRVVTHHRFGTAKWILDEPAHPLICEALLGIGDEELSTEQNAQSPNHPISQSPSPTPPPVPSLDMVTARTEFYTEPTVLPTVEQGSIKLDLHRRDFTINTMAIVLTPDRWGDLLDFYGGVADLNEGLIRVLHSLSFVDDPTRILRAVRYEQRFDFVIEPRTMELLADALSLIERVSPARVRHELERILQEPTPAKILSRLDVLGVLAAIHPKLTVDKKVSQHFESLRLALTGGDPLALVVGDADPLVRLYWGLWIYPLLPAREPTSSRDGHVDALDREEADWQLSERLGLQGKTKKLMHALRVLKANRETLFAPDARPSQIVAILDRVSASSILLLSIAEESDALTHRLRRYVEEWQQIQPSIGGGELRQMGLTPGPIFGEILNGLRAVLLDGEIGTEEEKAWVEKAWVEREIGRLGE